MVQIQVTPRGNRCRPSSPRNLALLCLCALSVILATLQLQLDLGPPAASHSHEVECNQMRNVCCILWTPNLCLLNVRTV